MMLYVSLVIMTMLGAVASLALKKACGAQGLLAIAKSGFLYVGGFLYLSTAVINIFLLRYLDYSVVLPFTSLTYVWSTILSAKILKEHVSKKQMTGLALIVLGTCLLIL